MSTPTPPAITRIGKQPIIDYVTKDYAGFRQGMIDLIPLLLPNWTDRSESDFGVVLIEMFAYVADILSYYQDRVANEAYLSTATQRRSVIELLRLIDYRVDPGLSASVTLHIDVTGDATIDGGQLPYRVKAVGIPGQPDRIFEMTQPVSLHLANNAIVVPAALAANAATMQLPTGSHALGRGDVVYFEEAAPGKRVRRTAPLTIIDVQNVGLVDGVNTDQVSWLPPIAEPYGDPTNTKLKGNNARVTHGETIANEPTYVGDGTPSQSFTLSRKPVSFLLAAPAPSRRRRSAPELQVTVDGVLWDLVDNFFGSLAFDTHYTVTVDEDDLLTVHFGTGRRGAIVPSGAQVKAVYRVGLGQAGNVGPDTITVTVSSVGAVKAVSNPFGAQGGADRESNEEAKVSGPGSVISQERAVTLQDYELLAKAFPGVGKARARVGLRGGYKVVQVYIAPEDASGTVPLPPSADLKAALKQELESRMPVNRMAGVDVLDPSYVAIDVTVDVHAKADASASLVHGAAQTALVALLSFPEVDFGSAVRLGDIYATLFPIPGISFTQLRRLARSGAPQGMARSACDLQDVALLENEIPFAGQLVINVIGGGP